MGEESYPIELRLGSIGLLCHCQAWRNVKGLWRGKSPGENLAGLETRPMVGRVLHLKTSSPTAVQRSPGRSTETQESLGGLGKGRASGYLLIQGLVVLKQ